jgi:hypothetical protein
MYIVKKEGEVGFKSYDLEELKLIVGSKEIISGKVIRLTSDDKLIIDLGNENYVTSVIEEEVLKLTGLKVKLGKEYWD